MDVINWILNIAAIVLWIDWRSGRAVKEQPPALSLASAVRPVESRRSRGVGSLAALLGLILLRPLFYFSVGAGLRWTPRLDLLAISIPWRSDLFDRIAIYSTASFALSFARYFAVLLLLSVAGRRVPLENPVRRFIRLQLGWLDRLPWPVKILLPSCMAWLAWAGLADFLVSLGLLPPAAKPENVWGQGAALALATLLVFRWVLVVLFVTHFVNLYVYLGRHPVWEFISQAARFLLWPLSFLRFGKVDLAPLAGLGVVLALCEFAIRPLAIHVFQQFIT